MTTTTNTLNLTTKGGENKMKKMAKILMILMAIVFVSVQTANAVPTLRITNDIGVTTVSDNGVGDANALLGIIDYSLATTQWVINATLGITMPVLGTASLPTMHLHNVEMTNLGSGPASMTIEFSADGFGPLTFPGLQTDVGGTTGGTVDFQAYVDSTNALFGTGTTIANLGPYSPVAFSGTQVTGGLAPATPFSMTAVAHVTHPGALQVTSFDLNIAPVPEPSTLILLGSGLVGVFFAGRRMKK